MNVKFVKCIYLKRRERERERDDFLFFSLPMCPPRPILIRKVPRGNLAIASLARFIYF